MFVRLWHAQRQCMLQHGPFENVPSQSDDDVPYAVAARAVLIPGHAD